MNEQRDKFLVEQEGGCWHENLYEGGRFICACGKYHCKSDFGGLNPDFSKPENFIGLLELAKKENIGISFNSCSKTIYLWRIDLLSIPSVLSGYDDISQIPSITADLIAQAMGWEEVKK